MKLNVYKNQREIEKTFEVDAYDLMYGTVEDILSIVDGLDENSTNNDFIKVIQENKEKLNELILDIFPDMQKEDLRKIKIKELIPLFTDLFAYVKNSFGVNGKN